MARGTAATRRASACAVAFIAATGAAVDAWAAEWIVSPAVTVNESYTDNRGLVAKNANPQSEFTTSVRPSVAVRGTGGRASLDLLYSLEEIYFHRQGEFDTRNALNAQGRVEVWEQQVFIDGKAAIGRAPISTRGLTSPSPGASNVNQAETRTFSLTPTFLHHFGTFAESRALNEFSWISSGSSTLSDTFTNRQILSLNSGRSFTTFRWGITGENSKTERSGLSNTESDRKTVATNYSYQVNDQVQLLAGFGYEKIDDPTLRENIDGPTWNVGIALRPSPRSSLTVRYNSRYEREFFTFDGSYRISPFTLLTSTLSQSIQSSQSLLNRNLNFLGVDAAGNFIDLRTGQPFDLADSPFGIAGDQLFFQRRWQAGISGTRGRSSYAAQVFWESRETEGTGSEEESTGGTVRFSRRITPQLTGAAALSYTATDVAAPSERSQTTELLNLSLDYGIFRNLSSTLAYNLIRRETDNSDEDVVENAVFLTLRQRF